MLLAALIPALVQTVDQPAGARNQWDINHGGTNPSPYPLGDPRFAMGGYPTALRPQPAQNLSGILQNQIGNRVQTGTVLTATMLDTITSRTSKPGDVFSLSLEDGLYGPQGMIIPPKSRVKGVVTNAYPALAQRGQGQPGRLSISFQALECADGRTVPISCFMDQNPNHLVTGKPRSRSLGYSIADAGSSVKGMFGSVLTGPGYLMKRRNRGNEFVLEKGEIVPLRLTRALIMPDAPPQQQAQMSAPQQQQQQPPVPVQNQAVPGLVEATSSQAQSADPNAVFNMPLDPQPQLPGYSRTTAPARTPQPVPGLVEEPF